MMKSKSKVNRSILLQRTTIHLLLADRSVQVPARATLQLSPRPRVVIKFDLRSDDYEIANEIRSKQFMEVRLEQGPNISVLIGDNWHLGKTVSNILIPTERLVTILNKKTKMSKCKFSLINFPSLWGEQDIEYTKEVNGKTNTFVTQHLQFQAHPWSIEISAVNSLMSLDYKLKRDGGSAITHVGFITRADGQDFCLKELELLLEALHLFFSFARGSYCGLTCLSGQDSSRKRIWQQWGTYQVEPWQRDLSTWVCGLQSEMLSPIFEGFWKLFAGNEWNDAISKAIHWYLRSNESNEPEISIILTHAALQRLSYATIGEKPQDSREGEWITKALKKMGIDHQIPRYCKELSRLRGQLNWSHGPHALVDMRNDLIHPKNRHGNYIDAYSEVWNLGQRYVELILLNLFGHTGQYMNRLKHGQGYKLEVEHVPWTTIEKGTP